MSEQAELELSIEEAKRIVGDRDAVKKLFGNREFKRIFVDGYFKDEALRLVGISADPTMDAKREAIQEEIRGISLVNQYLQNIIRFGDIAQDSLSEAYETLEEVRQEEEA